MSDTRRIHDKTGQLSQLRVSKAKLELRSFCCTAKAKHNKGNGPVNKSPGRTHYNSVGPTTRRDRTDSSLH